jgi:hypothetical protein
LERKGKTNHHVAQTAFYTITEIIKRYKLKNILLLFCFVKFYFFICLFLTLNIKIHSMKKIATLLSVVSVAAMTLVSCSKKGDYTCTCTVTDANGNNTTSSGGTWTDIKKSDAEDLCDAADQQLQFGLALTGGSGNCKLD